MILKILNEYFNQIIKSAKPILKIKDEFIRSLGLKGSDVSGHVHADNFFRFTILKEDKQDELMNRCKYIALKPFENFYCVAINHNESSIICSFKQKYRLSAGLRDEKYQLVTGDFKLVKKGDNATTFVAITKPRFSIKNDSELINIFNIIQDFIDNCIKIQSNNLISEKKKENPWLENFIKNIQSNIQEYIKSIIILPEENKEKVKIIFIKMNSVY